MAPNHISPGSHSISLSISRLEVMPSLNAYNHTLSNNRGSHGRRPRPPETEVSPWKNADRSIFSVRNQIARALCVAGISCSTSMVTTFNWSRLALRSFRLQGTPAGFDCAGAACSSKFSNNDGVCWGSAIENILIKECSGGREYFYHFPISDFFFRQSNDPGTA